MTWKLIAFAVLMNELLHQPIFQRVKTDNDKPASRLQHTQCTDQDLPNGSEFIVDVDAYGLEHPGCRMFMILPCRVGLLDDICKLQSCAEWRHVSLPDNCTCNASR